MRIWRMSASVAALAYSGLAMAQSAPSGDGEIAAAAAEQANAEPIVVTGSRIRTPNLESPNPIISLGSEDLLLTGKTNVQQMVAEVGALVGTDGDNETSTGESALNLRNLGPNRTLTLINGQRFVGGFAGSTAVDVNIIPTALIERVDVLTGGASAIYGADAVTGVVNFILKRNFEGLAFDAQYGDAERGDYRDQVYSLTAGRNFADGRGNLTVNYTFGERPLVSAFARREASIDMYEQINNQNGTNPQFVLAKGVKESFFTDGGARIDPFNAISAGGFKGDGSLFVHGKNVGSFAGTGEIGGDGIDDYKLFSEDIRPGNKRHIFTFRTHFDVSDSFKPYFDAHYSRVKTRALEQESLTVGMPVALDNAFLPASVVAAALAAPASALPVRFNRWDLDSGDGDNRTDKETFRFVGGARGDLSDHLQYDVSVNYGEVNSTHQVLNNRMFDRYIAAIDSVDDGTGKIVCRSSINPGSFNGLRSDFLANFNPAGGAVTFTPGAASGCVPFNPFTTNNSVNDAARAWIWIPTFDRLKNTQTVVSGFLTADTGGFFNLPGGAVNLVLGAEYRKETSAADFDDFSGAPRTVAQHPGRDLAGEFDVKELFGEASLPVFSDVSPFLRKLTIDGAYRYSNYSTIGSTHTWKAGAIFETIGGLTLRGTISSAVRAPNIQELFEPQTMGTASLGQRDPCSFANVDLGSSTRKANCATALTALGVNPATFNPLLGTFFPATTGGNINLKEETAKTKTIGFLWQPEFLPRFLLSVDYYDIVMKDAVLRPSSQAIFNACYDAPNLDNVFCSLLTRQNGTGFATSVEIQSVNVANLYTSGVEFAASYSVPTDNIGTFRGQISGNWLRRLEIQKTPLPVLTDDRGLFNTDTGGSSPKWVINAGLAWTLGKLDVNYGFNYSSKTLRPPLLNAARDTAASYIDEPFVRAFVNHDVQIGYRVLEDSRIYIGVNNITDEYPDKLRGSLNGPSGRQGFAGRSYYAGINLKFADIFK